ncbi:hypothetical protein KKR91_11855 [Arthrobacter jiangjiafuii]|uniref:DUF8094 domain-containing protein n=1 Tax=Arthrobacter jiangjiafuii TaxID=2817475 RepID=A0A975M3C5_9MICC|nr:hypothetical protein [Arthrobacter jiangjiafuii]MBP3044938.1 hypothetical protein [Arthrobacter jiangjiafuii]QWC09190.1 hypothetical protein KKR91_11855 [Arthrobacter jiangjiafuii]
MRNKIAVPLIVIGVLLMLVGIGQRTLWAPPETVTASAPSTDAQAPLTVIGSDVLTAHPEGVDLTVSADGPFTMAVGRADDVDAWVADASALRIGSDGDALTAEVSEGTPTVPSPAGSDLWVSEQEVDGELLYTWEAPADGEWKILLATDGTAAAPADVAVTYANDAATPFAVPLIVLGALAAVLGLALAFVSGRGNSGRRSGGRGPSAGGPADLPATRATEAPTGATTTLPAPIPAGSEPAAGPTDRGPRGAGTTRAQRTLPASGRGPAAALGTVLTAALVFGAAPGPALAGVPLTAAPSAESAEAAPPVVLEPQLERILNSVSASVAAADAAKDPSLLAARTGGMTASLREASYATAAKVPDHTMPAPVAAEPLMTDLIMGGTEFPRSVVAVTQGADNPVPQALLLVQNSARENYKLVSAVQMLPGTSFPKRPAGSEGVTPAPADSAEGLAAAPQAAVDNLADALTNPTGANKDTFSANTFAEAVTKFQSDVVANPENEFANITFSHSSVPEDTRALRTADGGAIVFGYMRHTYSSAPREAGDSINLEGTVYQTLTGETSTEAGIDVNYGEGVMMYVPPAGSTDQIQVIGAVQELLSATLK